jgi:hypothetical protein
MPIDQFYNTGIDQDRFEATDESERALAQGIANMFIAMLVDLTKQGIDSRRAVHLMTAATGAALGMALGNGVRITMNPTSKPVGDLIDEEMKNLIDTFNTNLRSTRAQVEMMEIKPEGRA